MPGWFDEHDGDADEPAVPLPRLSPSCAAAAHHGCEGWWWKEHKSIAVTCGCWCHQAPATSSGAGRAPRLGACAGWAGPWQACS
jgi:hypothetical protein